MTLLTTADRGGHRGLQYLQYILYTLYFYIYGNTRIVEGNTETVCVADRSKNEYPSVTRVTSFSHNLYVV